MEILDDDQYDDNGNVLKKTLKSKKNCCFENDSNLFELNEWQAFYFLVKKNSMTIFILICWKSI